MKDSKFQGKAGITGIGTSIPSYKLVQGDVFQRIEESCQKDSDMMRWARRIFRQCGVDTRYTCEPDLLLPAGVCRYLPGQEVREVPSTSERMEVYQRESVPLAVQAAREAMEDAGLAPSGITHLITVSCTGQFLPGLDTLLTKELHLSPRIQRIPLTFQGCSAGLKGVQLAKSIAESSAASQVLVVCVELCTIHFQPPTSRENLFGASFFGDGASACIVSPLSPGQRYVIQLGEGNSVLVPDSESEMIWKVGDHGFDLYLSPAIPKLLRTFLGEEVNRLLAQDSLPPLWAIHPGGRGIVDAVQDIFGLDDAQVSYSRDILQQFGNLSSATILFVWKRMRDDLMQRGIGQAEGLSLAFGPGLTAELLCFSYTHMIQEPLSAGPYAAYV